MNCNDFDHLIYCNSSYFRHYFFMTKKNIYDIPVGENFIASAADANLE